MNRRHACQLARLAVRRYWTAGRLTALFVNPVIHETDDSMSLWQPIGMRYWRILDRQNRTQHAAPFGVLRDDAVLSPAIWTGQDAVITLSFADPFCVYSFWSELGEFASFFGNVQLPTRVTRLADGEVLLDSTDLAADVVFHGYGSYEWRDLDELEDRADHDGYWQRSDIPLIIGWGEQLIERWEGHRWPFPADIEPPTDRPGWQGPDSPKSSWLAAPLAQPHVASSKGAPIGDLVVP
jgi:hypothetical protein